MGRTQRRRLKRKSEFAIPENADYLPELYQFLLAAGWRNENGLCIRDFIKTGRGLQSKTTKFNANDELIRLPAEKLISVATLEADDAFKTLFDSHKFGQPTKLSFQALMAFYLVYQQHLDTKKNSSIRGYLRSLPSSYTTPYFCTLPELQCLPEAVLECTVAQNRKIRDNYLWLKAVIAGDVENAICNCCGKQFFSEIYTLAEFKLAFFAVNTRSVYVNAHMLKPFSGFFQTLLADNANMALAPFLDLFNHSDKIETHAMLMPSTRSPQGDKEQPLDFVLTLIHARELPIKPYKQIYISYGPLPNLHLLTEYGFILPYNQHDCFQFSLYDIEQLIKWDKEIYAKVIHRNVFQFIRDRNLDIQMFIHIDQGCSHNLSIVLHLIFKQRNHYPNVLKKIAYGNIQLFDDVNPVLLKLLVFKILQYERFICALLKISDLSPSGVVVMDYLLGCVRYLKACSKKYGDTCQNAK